MAKILDFIAAKEKRSNKDMENFYGPLSQRCPEKKKFVQNNPCDYKDSQYNSFVNKAKYHGTR